MNEVREPPPTPLATANGKTIWTELPLDDTLNRPTPTENGHTTISLSSQLLLSFHLLARAYPPMYLCVPPTCPPSRVCLSADPPAHLPAFRSTYSYDCPLVSPPAQLFIHPCACQHAILLQHCSTPTTCLPAFAHAHPAARPSAIATASLYTDLLVCMSADSPTMLTFPTFRLQSR